MPEDINLSIDIDVTKVKQTIDNLTKKDVQKLENKLGKISQSLNNVDTSGFHKAARGINSFANSLAKMDDSLKSISSSMEKISRLDAGKGLSKLNADLQKVDLRGALGRVEDIRRIGGALRSLNVPKGTNARLNELKKSINSFDLDIDQVAAIDLLKGSLRGLSIGSRAADNLRAFGSAVNFVKPDRIMRVATAMEKFQNIRINFSGASARAMNEFMMTVNAVDPKKITNFATAMTGLTGLGGIKFSKSASENMTTFMRELLSADKTKLSSHIQAISKLATEYEKASKSALTLANVGMRLGTVTAKSSKVALGSGEAYLKLGRNMEVTNRQATILFSNMSRISSFLPQTILPFARLGEAMGIASAVVGPLAAGFIGLVAAPAAATLGIYNLVEANRELTKAMSDLSLLLDTPIEKLDGMRDSLIQLTQTIPLGVDEMVKFTKVAAQMGIRGEKALVGFASAFAKLQFLTDVQGEEGARQFARFLALNDVDPGKAEEVGSVIREMGRSFATTESRILKFSTRLSSVFASLEKDEDTLLGLSAAMAGLGQAPERTTTALQKFGIGLDKVVSQGGKKLQDLSDMTGIATADLEKMAQTDISRLITAVIGSKADRDSLLGLLGTGSGARVVQVFEVMRKNALQLESAMDKAASANKNLLSEQTAEAAENFDGKVRVLSGNIENLRATLFGVAEADLKDIIDQLDKMVLAFGGLNKEAQAAYPSIAAFGSFVREDLIPAVTGFTKFLVENGDTVFQFAKILTGLGALKFGSAVAKQLALIAGGLKGVKSAMDFGNLASLSSLGANGTVLKGAQSPLFRNVHVAEAAKLFGIKMAAVGAPLIAAAIASKINKTNRINQKEFERELKLDRKLGGITEGQITAEKLLGFDARELIEVTSFDKLPNFVEDTLSDALSSVSNAEFAAGGDVRAQAISRALSDPGLEKSIRDQLKERADKLRSATTSSEEERAFLDKVIQRLETFDIGAAINEAAKLGDLTKKQIDSIAAVQRSIRDANVELIREQEKNARSLSDVGLEPLAMGINQALRSVNTEFNTAVDTIGVATPQSMNKLTLTLSNVLIPQINKVKTAMIASAKSTEQFVRQMNNLGRTGAQFKFIEDQEKLREKLKGIDQALESLGKLDASGVDFDRVLPKIGAKAGETFAEFAARNPNKAKELSGGLLTDKEKQLSVVDAIKTIISKGTGEGSNFTQRLTELLNQSREQSVKEFGRRREVEINNVIRKLEEANEIRDKGQQAFTAQEKFQLDMEKFFRNQTNEQLKALSGLEPRQLNRLLDAQFEGNIQQRAKEQAKADAASVGTELKAVTDFSAAAQQISRLKAEARRARFEQDMKRIALQQLDQMKKGNNLRKEINRRAQQKPLGGGIDL